MLNEKKVRNRVRFRTQQNRIALIVPNCGAIPVKLYSSKRAPQPRTRPSWILGGSPGFSCSFQMLLLTCAGSNGDGNMALLSRSPQSRVGALNEKVLLENYLCPTGVSLPQRLLWVGLVDSFFSPWSPLMRWKKSSAGQSVAWDQLKTLLATLKKRINQHHTSRNNH